MDYKLVAILLTFILKKDLPWSIHPMLRPSIPGWAGFRGEKPRHPSPQQLSQAPPGERGYKVPPSSPGAAPERDASSLLTYMLGLTLSYKLTIV